MPIVRNTVVRQGPLESSGSASGVSVTVAPDGTVSGTAAPGARIEIANLSVAPTGFKPPEDLVEAVVADAQGAFSLKPGNALSGDVLSIHVRADASSPVSAAVQVRVNHADRADDPRAAFVSMRRVRAQLVRDQVVLSPRTSLPVSEPDATLRFTNVRTGTFVDVVTDPIGRFPEVRVPGQAGDTIDVSISDDIATRAPASVGTLAVEAPVVVTPEPVRKDASYAVLAKIPGRLFLDKLGLGKQGSIGDCPVPAAASAIAAVDESAVRDLIRDNGDDTFTVTFHPAGKDVVEITVDDKLYGRGGRPMYGTGTEAGAGIELWFPLVEKAYAAYLGSYDILTNGTSVGRVLADFLGRDNTEVWLNNANVDDVWNTMKRAAGHGQAMAAGTYPTSESARYRGTGLYANHAYSVLGLEERADGKRLVTMRNPWGGSAGFSGEFQLPIADFVALYQVLNVC